MIGHFFILIAVFSCFNAGAAVKCYICSFSPKENETQADFCTAENFQPDSMKTFNCVKGCEYVTKYDRNGVITSFFRNCANIDAPTKMKCNKTPGLEMSRSVCSCNTDLCNGLHSGAVSCLAPVFVLVLLYPAWQLVTVWIV